MHNYNFCNQAVGYMHGSNLLIELCMIVEYCLLVWKILSLDSLELNSENNFFPIIWGNTELWLKIYFCLTMNSSLQL